MSLCSATTVMTIDSHLPAIRNRNGALGCLESHLQWIRWAKDQWTQDRSFDFVALLEDDAQWDPEEVNRDLIDAIQNAPSDWDMLYLGGQTIPQTSSSSQDRSPSGGPWTKEFVLTTHAYLLHSRCFDRVIHDLDQIASGAVPFLTIDQYYTCFIHTLQTTYLHQKKWFTQRAGYSHIENAYVDYGMVLDTQDPIEPGPPTPSPTLSFHDLPGVTIVTPTTTSLATRRSLLRSVVLPSILGQTYPRDRIQWIIVDEKEYGAADPQPIRYPSLTIDHLVLEKEQGSPLITVAQKRNIGAKMARYEWIVHMDDDDYYPPESVMLRVTPMLADPTIRCVGCSEIVTHDLIQHTSYRHRQSSLYEATMAYHRTFWEHQPFENHLSRGEGLSLLYRRHRDCRTVTAPCYDIIVSLLHHQNVSGTLRQGRPSDTDGTGRPSDTDDSHNLFGLSLIPDTIQKHLRVWYDVYVRRGQ